MSQARSSVLAAQPRRRRLVWSSLFTHLVLVLGGVVMIFPVLWMVSTSFKPATEVVLWPPSLLPLQPTLANYTTVFDTIPIVRYFLNSVIISVASTACVIVTSVVAGYVFAKFSFPGRDVLFFLILITAIVPFESYMAPLYLQMVQIKWINTYMGVIAPYALMAFGVFLMRQHMRSAIPDELIDAARIDGASEWRIFRSIVLALSLPAVGALGIFAFIQAWAAFLWPLLVSNKSDLFNLELGLNAFQFRYSVDYGPLMAGSVLSVAPMVLVFFLLRRQIIDSAAISGLRG